MAQHIVYKSYCAFAIGMGLMKAKVMLIVKEKQSAEEK
jgi:hypothetical protein